MRKRLRKKKSGRNHYYCLTKNGKFYPIKVGESNGINPKAIKKWTRNFYLKRRILAVEEITPGIKVSTVFLSLNYAHRSNTPPILFETMIFGGKYDQYQVRYTTYKRAIKGHRKVVSLARGTGE